MRLIITRPAGDAARMAEELRRLGHEAEIHPLIEIAFLPIRADALDGVSALIVTSRNALRSLGQSDALASALRRSVFCVGEATAAEAQRLGFTDVRTGPGAARDLLPIIRQAPEARAGRLLYLTGGHLAFDLEAALAADGLELIRVIAYEARELSPASAAALAAKLRTGVDGVILMSPRTALIFSRIFTEAAGGGERRAITCYCLSEAVAAPLRGIAGLTCRVARAPAEAEVLALTARAR